MSDNILDLEVHQGQDERFVLTVKDDEGVPTDITGRTFRSSAKTNYNSKVVFSFTFNILDQITKTGQVEMILSSAVSTAIKIPYRTTYIYDVEMVVAGVVTRIFQGKVYLDPEVTT